MSASVDHFRSRARRNPDQKNGALRLTETRRVLVIDDNIDAVDLFGTLFEHDVRTDYSGLEALAIARELAAAVICGGTAPAH